MKLENVISQIKPLKRHAMRLARQRQDSLTKPRGSLGRLEEIAVKLAGITGRPLPALKKKTIIVMAADHGITAEKVSAYPRDVTAQMVFNFINGGAAINVLARAVGAKVLVVDMGVDAVFKPDPNLVDLKIARGTGNMAAGPAMSRIEAVRSIEAGIGVVESQLKNGLDIVATGEMGIGNTSASSAVIAAVTGLPVSKVTGLGTGVSREQLQHKIKTIEKALMVNKPDPRDPIDVLAKVGGYEIGGLTGVILACAANRLPVVIDGFISGAAALLAAKLAPLSRQYMIASHCSAEFGHRALLKYLKLKPLLDLDMRLGEGSGAAIGIFLAETSLKIMKEMATFEEAAVSGKND